MFGMLMSFNCSQPQNAYCPIDLHWGSLTAFMFFYPIKTLSPILVQFGKSIFLILVKNGQFENA